MLFETRILRTAREKAVLHQHVGEGFTFFDKEMTNHRSYVAAFECGTIVGLVCIVETSARIPGALGIGYIETHLEHRQKGVAKALVARLFDFARAQDKAIANTHYEDDGLRWLAPLMQATALQYPDVTLHER
jgi:GNAT superfamily N-acetyltransferase